MVRRLSSMLLGAMQSGQGLGQIRTVSRAAPLASCQGARHSTLGTVLARQKSMQPALAGLPRVPTFCVPGSTRTPRLLRTSAAAQDQEVQDGANFISVEYDPHFSFRVCLNASFL